MIEVRFQGRGGQGAVVASELLAQAAFLEGRSCQSFPFFGVERRGAPVTAYCRIDERAIGVRTSVTSPDLVVVLDPGLLRTVPVTDGLRPDGLLLVNSHEPPETLVPHLKGRVATVDATGIALANGLGTPTLPIVNTALLGALANASGVVGLDALDRAIDRNVPSRRAENKAAAADGYGGVRWVVANGTPAAPAPVGAPMPLPPAPIASISSSVVATGAWRTVRPEIHLEKCTRCNFCWKFCPDLAIDLNPEGFPVLLAEYCKGCGICAEECPPHAIDLVAEV